LPELLDMLRDEFSAQLNVRQIAWLQPESVPDIRGDRLSILRVLRNLVENALKHGGDELSEIRIGCSESDQFYILSVSNNGVAIPVEDSERIFGPFQRHGKARGVEGTGLGLAIVKEVAKQHSGEVWVESEPDKGPTFYISVSRHL
jgi:signal transduction histidine kinase